MKWEIAYDNGEGNIEVDEVSGKLSLDSAWAFVLSPLGHISLAIPASRVVAINAVD